MDIFNRGIILIFADTTEKDSRNIVLNRSVFERRTPEQSKTKLQDIRSRLGLSTHQTLNQQQGFSMKPAQKMSFSTSDLGIVRKKLCTQKQSADTNTCLQKSDLSLENKNNSSEIIVEDTSENSGNIKGECNNGNSLNSSGVSTGLGIVGYSSSSDSD